MKTDNLVVFSFYILPSLIAVTLILAGKAKVDDAIALVVLITILALYFIGLPPRGSNGKKLLPNV